MIKKLNQEQLDSLLTDAANFVKEHPYIRMGQALYNILFDRNPDLARRVCGSEYDCFYNDDRIHAFIKFVSAPGIEA